MQLHASLTALLITVSLLLAAAQDRALAQRPQDPSSLTTGDAIVVHTMPTEVRDGSGRSRQILDARQMDQLSGKMVFLRFGEYRRLVARKRELEEKLQRAFQAGPPVDAVISRAHYTVRVDAGPTRLTSPPGSPASLARVTARFSVELLKDAGFRQLPLVGGRVAVSRFTSALADSYLAVREMMARPQPVGVPADQTLTLIASGTGRGEVVLAFTVPVVETVDGGRVSFAIPSVPVSALDLGIDERCARVSVEPSVGRSEAPELPGYRTHCTVAPRSGGELTIAWVYPQAPAPPQPVVSPSPVPVFEPRIVLDRVATLFTIEEERLLVKAVLDVEVSGGQVEKLVVKKARGVQIRSLVEQGGTRMLEPRLPDEAAETAQLRFREPFQGLLRIALEAESRIERGALDLTLSPFTLDSLDQLRDGFMAVTTRLPIDLEAIEKGGARAIKPSRLPAELTGSGRPVLRAFEYRKDGAGAEVRLTRHQPLELLRGVISNLDVTTNLAGESGFKEHYSLTVLANGEDKLRFAFPAKERNELLTNVSVRPLSQARESYPDLVREGDGRYRILLGGPIDGPLQVKFDVLHQVEPLKGYGTVSVPLARFEMPLQELTWTVQKPREFRFYGFQGPFRELESPREFFLMRFVTGIWATLRNGGEWLFQPARLPWLLLVVLIGLLAWSVLTGELPLSISWGQLAAVASVGAVGVVLVLFLQQVALRAPSPGELLSRNERAQDGPFSQPSLGIQTGSVGSGDRRLEMRDDLKAEEFRRGLPRIGLETLPTPPSGQPTATPSPASTPVIRESVTPPAASLPFEQKSVETTTLSRSILMARSDAEEGVRIAGFTATFFERKNEWLVNGFAFIAGFVLFGVIFLGSRELIGRGTMLAVGLVGLLAVWAVDLGFPFALRWAAAGFGLPVLLIAGVRGLWRGIDLLERWREEGVRRQAQIDRFRSSRDQAQAHSHSHEESATGGGLGRERDVNEVSIKEIFAETPTRPTEPGSDGIDFVADEDDDEEGADKPDPKAPAEGGERP
ncbi:MAG: hypothetical protein HY815_13915 [Candidatus Riflebacteria bacterium]|nr:hypothetical protein [Candidatus Riflebacteria bacterium]